MTACSQQEALGEDGQNAIRTWCSIWRIEGLADEVRVRFSKRMRRTLGRCRPDLAEVRLASWLCEAPVTLLEEVLCHEVAHAAVHRLHGAVARPHGPEWRRLMRAAGYAPRVRLPPESIPESLRARTRTPMPIEHHCPVCDLRRNTRRAMPHWRCARCLAAGRAGRLEIRRVECAPASSQLPGRLSRSSP